MPEDQPIVIIKTKVPFYLSRKFYLLGVAVLIISIVIGIFTAKYSPFFKSKATDQFLLKEPAKLPISLDLLQNSMLSNWTARVEGRIMAKDIQSFTISHIQRQFSATGSAAIKDVGDSKQLQIIYLKDKTSFKQTKHTREKEETITINFPDLTIGSLVTGTIEMYQTNNKWFLIGKNFTII